MGRAALHSTPRVPATLRAAAVAVVDDDGRRRIGRSGRSLVEGAVTMQVVVLDMLGKDCFEVTVTEDETGLPCAVGL